MERRISLTVVVLACIGFLISDPTRADIPAPPVNQTLGLPDVLANNLEEADCRV